MKKNNELMRPVNFDAPEKLYRRIKMLSAERGLKMRELLCLILQDYIDKKAA